MNNKKRKKRQLTVQIEDKHIKKIDERAKKIMSSRSYVMRRLIIDGLEQLEFLLNGNNIDRRI